MAAQVVWATQRQTSSSPETVCYPLPSDADSDWFVATYHDRCFSLRTKDMANTPDANITQLPTDLSYLHQLSEESERDNHLPFPGASDTPAKAGEPNQSLPPSNSSGSQLTSSDKLFVLPSHLRSSPTGRSAISLRLKCGIPEDSELPSTSETCFPLPLISRAALPISHSVQWSERYHHDSAFRLTVIEDHQLALAQVSIRRF
ncbi:hypothetical protein EDB86DRAFT_609840 [Lactarius hatsudake]|nr:hypothetical protein EDB86DRAFT_609840 [Lactarius hatsudake]